jgi:rhomboid protease GluP
MDEFSDGEEQIVPPDDQKTLEWATVLSAADIDYRLARSEAGWLVYVPRTQSAAARGEIAAYEADTSRPVPAQPESLLSWPRQQPTAAIWGAGLLLILYTWLGPYDPERAIMRTASADAEAMLAGEWWRAVTALTLHAGAVHIAANIASLLFFGHAVCSLFGGGLGWFAVLGTGIAGNAAVALTLKSEHISIGASTAGFGAVGILAAHQTLGILRRGRPWRSAWSRAWIPLGAGLALLTLMGTGPESDLAAHLFGFLFGIVFAVPLCAPEVRRPPGWAQRLLALVCVLVLALSWAAAVRSLT